MVLENTEITTRQFYCVKCNVIENDSINSVNTAENDWTIWQFSVSGALVIGTHLKNLSGKLLMCTHNIHFLWRNKKNTDMDTHLIWSYVINK